MIFGLMFDPIFVPHFSELKSFDLASIPHFFKFKLSLLEPAPKNRMTNKVYLGKKVAIPKLTQVQESEPTFGKEITVSHPFSRTKSKFLFEKSVDQNLLIAVMKETRECIKHPWWESGDMEK